MTALPSYCPVRGCGINTNATWHWPFCDEHYLALPRRCRNDLLRLIDLCYQSGGAPDDQAALLRGIEEATAALTRLRLV